MDSVIDAVVRLRIAQTKNWAQASLMVSIRGDSHPRINTWLAQKKALARTQRSPGSMVKDSVTLKRYMPEVARTAPAQPLQPSR